jgi:hypothetical protein
MYTSITSKKEKIFNFNLSKIANATAALQVGRLKKGTGSARRNIPPAELGLR